MAFQETGGIARAEAPSYITAPAAPAAGPSVVEESQRQNQNENQRRETARPRVIIETERTSEAASVSTAARSTASEKSPRARRKGRVASFSRVQDIYNAKAEFPALRLFQIARPVREETPFSALFALSQEAEGSESNPESSRSEGAESSSASPADLLPPSLKETLLGAFTMPTDQYMSGYLVNNLV